MAKVKISEFDVNPDNNTDINNINIAEGCAPSGINNAIRQLMSDLKEFQTGAGGDSITAVGVYSDTVGEKTSGAGVTVDGVLLKDNAVTASGGFSGALNGAVGGTTPAAGAFTTLSASSTLTVTGAGSIQGLTVGRGAGAVSSNTAVGASALAANTTGQYNTMFGNGTGNAITTSQQNSFFGYQSGFKTTGGNNTAIGSVALYQNTSGAQNTALGVSALENNTTASNNTAVGYQAGYSNTTGTSLDAFGYRALYANTTGTFNAAFGNQSLTANTTGGTNTGIGYATLFSNTTASNNSAAGFGALYNNTTGGANTAFGTNALLSNTTASNNTAVGYQAGYSNTTGTHNTVVGYQAGYNNTTGAYGTYLGNYAGRAITTGQWNIAIGDHAMGDGATNTANGNLCIGNYAGGSLTTGTKNTFIGGTDPGIQNGTGQLITTGSNNTILGGYNGNQGGLDIRTANNYIVLSDGDGNPRAYWDASGNYQSAGQLNSTNGGRFGTNQSATAFISQASVGGGTTTYYIGNQSITTSSDVRLKENIVDSQRNAIEILNQLRVVDHTWNDPSDQCENNRNSRGVWTGLIAQEAQTVIPWLVNKPTTDVDENGNPIYWQMDYGYAVPLLIKAIQELKAEVDSLKAQLNNGV